MGCISQRKGPIRKCQRFTEGASIKSKQNICGPIQYGSMADMSRGPDQFRLTEDKNFHLENLGNDSLFSVLLFPG